jgi:hypothetical protein
MLLSANLLGSYPVLVERHSSLISSYRVVSSNFLSGISDKEIQSTLANQSMSKAYQLVGKRDDTIPTENRVPDI